MNIIVLPLIMLIILFIIKHVLQAKNMKENFRDIEKNNDMTIITSNELQIKDKDFYRDIPFDKNKYYIYYISTLIKDYKHDTIKQIYFIQGCIVDFIQEGILELKRESGKMQLVIKNNTKVLDNPLDYEFLEILKSLADNNIITKEKISKIDTSMSNRIIQWYINSYEYAQKLWYQKTPEERHEDIAITQGLQKYLLEYSLISEKNPEEVIIWAQYLTFSVILGIANNVSEELKEIISDEWVTGVLIKSRKILFNNFKKAFKL